MISWYTKIVGWMIRQKESIEKAVEPAFPYKTDVANLHSGMQFRGLDSHRACPYAGGFIAGCALEMS